MSKDQSNVAVIGLGGSGKSTLIRYIAGQLRAAGRPAVVCASILEDEWREDCPPEHFTDDLDELNQIAKSSQLVTFAYEEALGTFGGNPTKEDLWGCIQGRHKGHISIYGAQSYLNFSTLMRTNVRYLAAYRQDEANARKMAQDFNCKELLRCPELKKLQYIWVDRDHPHEAGLRRMGEIPERVREHL